MLPIESSLIGPIAETHDLLYGSALSIIREATLPITHCSGWAARRVARTRPIVRSHPAAFDQCRDLLATGLGAAHRRRDDRRRGP